MAMSKRQIEECFGIVGKCDWLFDDHEQCRHVDQETVCGVLGSDRRGTRFDHGGYETRRLRTDFSSRPNNHAMDTFRLSAIARIS